MCVIKQQVDRVTGRIMTSDSGLLTLLELRNALTKSVKDPTAGLWLIELSAHGAHTVRITGLSSLDFVHGFSLRPTLALGETELRPTKGKFHQQFAFGCV